MNLAVDRDDAALAQQIHQDRQHRIAPPLDLHPDRQREPALAVLRQIDRPVLGDLENPHRGAEIDPPACPPQALGPLHGEALPRLLAVAAAIGIGPPHRLALARGQTDRRQTHVAQLRRRLRLGLRIAPREHRAGDGLDPRELALGLRRNGRLGIGESQADHRQRLDPALCRADRRQGGRGQGHRRAVDDDRFGLRPGGRRVRPAVSRCQGGRLRRGRLRRGLLERRPPDLAAGGIDVPGRGAAQNPRVWRQIDQPQIAAARVPLGQESPGPSGDQRQTVGAPAAPAAGDQQAQKLIDHPALIERDRHFGCRTPAQQPAERAIGIALGARQRRRRRLLRGAGADPAAEAAADFGRDGNDQGAPVAGLRQTVERRVPFPRRLRRQQPVEKRFLHRPAHRGIGGQDRQGCGRGMGAARAAAGAGGLEAGAAAALGQHDPGRQRPRSVLHSRGEPVFGSPGFENHRFGPDQGPAVLDRGRRKAPHDVFLGKSDVRGGPHGAGRPRRTCAQPVHDLVGAPISAVSLTRHRARRPESPCPRRSLPGPRKTLPGRCRRASRPQPIRGDGSSPLRRMIMPEMVRPAKPLRMSASGSDAAPAARFAIRSLPSGADRRNPPDCRPHLRRGPSDQGLGPVFGRNPRSGQEWAGWSGPIRRSEMCPRSEQWGMMDHDFVVGFRVVPFCLSCSLHFSAIGRFQPFAYHDHLLIAFETKWDIPHPGGGGKATGKGG